MKPTEHEIQKAIIEYLETMGHIVTRVNSGKMKKSYGGKTYWINLAKPGTSDLLVCQRRTGMFWAIEVKREGENLRPEQVVFMNEVSVCGGKTLVARDVNDCIKAGL